MKIEYTEKPTKEFEDKATDGLTQHARENSVNAGYKDYAFIIRNNKEEIIGGLNGHALFGEISIDHLWIDSSCRGKGYGTMLVNKVYEHFKDKGYDNINVKTNEFQAPKFYEKCGYELEFVRKKKNEKLNRYFFIKRFDNN